MDIIHYPNGNQLSPSCRPCKDTTKNQTKHRDSFFINPKLGNPQKMAQPKLATRMILIPL
ncbi:hypothetical protein SynA1560_02083 [Synechococcus sp. A15-60]|nr:hypothetical protein SynA1560_02083 [Synechococcus sp. A15-60]